jgi:hypothetical protein
MVSKLKNSPAYGINLVNEIGFGSSQRFNTLPTNINDNNYTPGPIYESSDRFKFYKVLTINSRVLQFVSLTKKETSNRKKSTITTNIQAYTDTNNIGNGPKQLEGLSN